MIGISALASALLTILVAFLIIGAFIWILERFAIAEPFRSIVGVIVIVILVLTLVHYL